MSEQKVLGLPKPCYLWNDFKIEKIQLESERVCVWGGRENYLYNKIVLKRKGRKFVFDFRENLKPVWGEIQSHVSKKFSKKLLPLLQQTLADRVLLL